MKEKISSVLCVLLVILFTLFIIGFISGLMFGVHYNKSVAIKEVCDSKPQSIIGHIFYPIKWGEKVGCFLSKPRFNLPEQK